MSEASAKNSPKFTKDLWQRVRMEFEAGTFKSLSELAERYSINPITLRTKMYRSKWAKKLEAVQNKVEQKVVEYQANQVQEYLSSSFLRGKKYEKMIDASIQNSGSKDAEGTPVLDPEAIEAYTKTEARIHALCLSALRVAPVSQEVSLTGKLDIQHSLVTAIQKLREAPAEAKIDSRIIDKVLECEIVEDNEKS